MSPLRSAGRSAGPFLSAVRAAARDADLWVCCGVVLQGNGPASVTRKMVDGSNFEVVLLVI